MPGHRKKPFSNKQRKEQLKAKRERKKVQERDEFGNVIRSHKGKHAKNIPVDSEGSSEESDSEPANVRLMNPQPGKKVDGKGYDPNRYRLHFLHESKEEIEKRKVKARQPFQTLPEEALEMDFGEVYVPGSVLDMPKRPPWDYKMSKQQVEAREEKYFKAYLDNILEKYSTEELSYFEVNLETWRQLWRVVEMADVILLITDIRHPALHFCPTFYNYITKELNKPMILVLNKIDIAAPSLVVAWKHYMEQRFPDIHIVCFTSFPKDKKEIEECHNPEKILHRKRKRGVFSAVGPAQLLEVCEKIVKGHVDLSSWKEKIDHQIAGIESSIETHVNIEEGTEYFHYEKSQKYKNNVLSIGCCGYPNVGKSSLINGLMGRKVVSVSKTPGHTKHFQTIFLTPHVKLCDSPGLVFPSLVPKPLQILAGIYPIAQVREPYTTVGFLAERINVQRLLKLTHPNAEAGRAEPAWSAMDICDAWAEKRGFLTAKAARNDVYRAANNILRFALEGRLIMCMRPTGYTHQKELWEKHLDTADISKLQEKHRSATRKESSEEEDLGLIDISDSEETDNEESDNSEQLASNSVGTNNPFALLEDSD